MKTKIKVWSACLLTKRPFIKGVLLLLTLACIGSCKRDESLSYMVKARQTLMYDQLKQDTSLTLAVQALEKANMAATLNTYGPFTFFAPDNNAFKQYIKAKGKSSLSDFTAAQLKTLMTYLIYPTRLFAANFTQGPQAVPSGAGDFLTLDISKGYRYNTVANGLAHVYQTDITYSNGLVHKMDAVLDPPTLTIGDFMSQNPNLYSVMTAGLKRAGLLDTLSLLNDKVLTTTRVSLTLFAETNDVLKAAGITSFDNMPLDELKSLMLYHIIKGNNFSSSYTPYAAPNTGLNLTESWASTIPTLDGKRWIYFNLADSKLINGSTIGLTSSDVLMRNGLIQNLDKHMVFDTTLNSKIAKRTQIWDYVNTNPAFAYGASGYAAGAAPPTVATGNWRIYTESGTGTTRGSINCLFFQPTLVSDSVVTVVKNIRRGTYRVEVNYKGGARGTYQLMVNNENVGIPTNLGQGTQWEQKLFIGNYTFKESMDYRFRWVCTTLGAVNFDSIVLTPIYN